MKHTLTLLIALLLTPPAVLHAATRFYPLFLGAFARCSGWAYPHAGRGQPGKQFPDKQQVAA